MTHAQGSPRAARRGAAEVPLYPAFDPYDAYSPYDPYEPSGHYATYEAHGAYGTSGAYAQAAAAPPAPAVPYGSYATPGEPYGIYEPPQGFYDPFLPEPREAGSYAPPADPDELPHLPRQGAGTAPAEELTETPHEPLAPLADPAGEPEGERAGARRSARRKRTGERPDALRRLVPQALVVAFLAGGTSAFIVSDKTVRLNVEGSSRTLHTFADDVEELLADENMSLGAHDAVTPGHDHGLSAGDEITVRYGRPVALTLDGEHRRVWTTARTVDGALRQLGVRAEGAYLSTSRSASIAREGLDLDVRTERTVTFMADGRERTIRTNAATVHEAIDQAGITLRGQDTTSVDPDSFPREGQTISVMRITGSQEVREVPIDFTTERRDDPTLFKGTEVVAQRGEKGVERVTYALRTVNGVKQKPRKISTETVRRPTTQIVKVGTKAMPTAVQGADGLNWDGLAQCEAGGRPNAVDPSGTYGGLYQFDVRTWQGLGGKGRPQDASAAEQTFRAKKLYVSRGASPWPVCGRKLHG
ncbi:ubiquitin-like domain-containing protein [Streptomyces albireticuli]|uniref:ubiquitin-like domain-containing protein n=1 Tax=Streptomyces albireticuli TaxID=1940 RepID=UPI0036C3DBEE